MTNARPVLAASAAAARLHAALMILDHVLLEALVVPPILLEVLIT